jgi:hypothetical protein
MGRWEMSNHNITIFSAGSDAFIRIQTDIKCDGSGDYYLDFKLPRSGEFEAKLLVDYLRERNSDSIKKVRKAEFMSGWKHAKAKKFGKGRFNWFMSNIRDEASHD